MSILPAGASRRYRFEWLLLGTVLLAVGLFLAWNAAADRRALRAAEVERLGAQARAIDDNLSRQLLGAYNALRSMRERYAAWGPVELQTTAVRRMGALVGAMPGVRSMALVGPDGRVLASNVVSQAGQDVSQTEAFRRARERADAGVVILAPPAEVEPGVRASTLALAIVEPDGAFGGVVTATLDPGYFEVALRSARDAPDMGAAVVHAEGDVLLASPSSASVPAAAVSRASDAALDRKSVV